MIQGRFVATALLCAAAPLSAALGQDAAGDTDQAAESVNLETDLSGAIVAEPLASPGYVEDPGLVGNFDLVVQNGPYLVAYLGATTIEAGDFDGSTILSAPNLNDLLFVPELDYGIGFGGGIGYRIDQFAFEFTYMRIEHDADFGGSPLGNAVANTFSVDFKYFLMTDQPLQPFVLVGLTVPWLKVENGSFDPTIPRTGDASYLGVGANLGGGVAFYFTPTIALTGHAGYRVMFFTEAKGVSDDRRSIQGNLDGSGFFAAAGITITF